MDDFMKDIFSDGEKKEVDAEKPIFENTEAPFIKNEVEAEPVIPQKTVQPQAEPAVNPEPVAPAVNPAPVQGQEQSVPPYFRNQNAEPQKNIFFTPPVQQPPVQPTQNTYQSFPKQPVQRQNTQNENNFDIPPAFNQPQSENPYNMNYYSAPPVKKPKKSKAGWIILVIAVLTVAIAASGLVYAVKTYSGNTDSGSSVSENVDGDGNDSNSGDAGASVNSSEKAAKTDSKGNLTVAGVVEQNKSSCVGITVYAKQDDFSYFYNFGSENNSSEGSEVKAGEGSGVIMSESKGVTYIMTCAHVISDGTRYTVTLDNDKEYEATFVGADSQTDIGVLSIKATGLNVAEFGDSKDIEVGSDCVAIGCPGGLEFKNSVTKGIVSALDVPVASTIGYNNECIQVDAAINPGNSGGALFNMQGQVIGINSSKIASTEYEGMGFAVPSNTAVSTANSLIKYGYVKGRARLGIQYATLSMLRNGGTQILSALEQKGFKDAQGTMIVQSIDSNSDLNGKVQQNDMIVAVNGKTMTSTDVMTSALSKSKPGDTITLTIARIDGNSIKTFEVKCKLIEAKNN